MILYFSGTGNSKYVAKRIADALGDALVNLNDRIKASDTSLVETGERVIIVTPTYAWRIPHVVRDWLRKTELRGAKRSSGSFSDPMKLASRLFLKADFASSENSTTLYSMR